MSMPLILAGDLKKGSKLYEADGYPFEVTEIVKETAKTITVRVCSEWSMISSLWASEGGDVKTFRKSTMLYGHA